nr:hypothetical protein GCM10020093_027640 [Planobispora longispora]
MNTLFTIEGGQAAAQLLLEQGCTAICCGSDIMAIGVIRAVRQRGLRVPQDISVVGFDDSLFTPYLDPPLTTIRQPVREMSLAAVSALLDEIGGTKGPRTELLYRPELVVRGSTAPAPLSLSTAAAPDLPGTPAFRKTLGDRRLPGTGASAGPCRTTRPPGSLGVHTGTRPAYAPTGHVPGGRSARGGRGRRHRDDRERAGPAGLRLLGARPDRRGLPPAAGRGGRAGLAGPGAAVVRGAGPGVRRVLPALAGHGVPRQADRRAVRRHRGRLWEQIDANILNQSGERHRRLRALVGPAFTPRAADRWRPAMREFLTLLWDGLRQDGKAQGEKARNGETRNEKAGGEAGGETASCEFVEAVARPYPALTVAAVLGAPAADAPRLHEWSNWVQRQFDIRSLATELPRIERAVAEVYDYVEELLAERRVAPGDDLVSALLAAEEEGERLSHAECVNLVLNVLAGGVDTTQAQLAHALRLFAGHPGQWELLAADPGLAGRAVQEVLRFEPITPFTARVCLEQVEYRGWSSRPGRSWRSAPSAAIARSRRARRSTSPPSATPGC